VIRLEEEREGAPGPHAATRLIVNEHFERRAGTFTVEGDNQCAFLDIAAA
jgi:hypothetical protein